MDSNLGRGNRLFSSTNRPDSLWSPLNHLFNGYPVFFGIKRPGRDIEKSSPSSVWVKNGRVTHLLSFCTSTALKGTIFPLLCILYQDGYEFSTCVCVNILHHKTLRLLEASYFHLHKIQRNLFSLPKTIYSHWSSASLEFCLFDN